MKMQSSFSDCKDLNHKPMRTQVYLLLLIAFLFSVNTAFLPSFQNEPAVVTIEGGKISGLHTSDNKISIYKGIPFAAPPVGNLRWKAPQPVIPWSGVRKCEAFGASPMQGSPAPFSMWSAEFLIAKEPISEDCLNLNVWTDNGKKSSTPRPVIVWIYGGGFGSGGSSCAIYDGEAMARKGVVFVSINYRVGPFGFFAHPELTAESEKNASGNYGIMDQIAALQWVKKNIAQFGGDPANVTIAGQSAGSMSVNCLVASPLAKNLFNKAIAESGAGFARPYAPLQKAEESGLGMAKALNVSTLADLRKVPAEEILKKTPAMRGPIVDGYVLPASIADIFAAGKQNDVILLTGWNEDEGLSGKPKSAADYQKQIREQYGAQADELLKFYPANTEAEAASSQNRMSRDMTFGAQNYAWTKAQSSAGKKVYLYRFDRKVPATGEYSQYGAFHTAEVAYAYDNLRFINHQLRPLEPADDKIAHDMSRYWANFVKTGNPNGNGLPQWPLYDAKEKQIMVIGTGARSLPDAASLDFLLNVISNR
jgi:para-nitrobenzyl esterase